MINFLKYRTIALSFSIFVILGTAGLYFYKRAVYGHAFRFSVDFTGGTSVRLQFDKAVGSEQIESILSKHGWEQVSTREFADTNEVEVRVPEVEVDAQGLGARIAQVLQDELPDNKVTVVATESVGPGVGKALRTNSIYAIIFALLAMLAYISIRFWSIGFAAGSVFALLHDAVVILGLFMILDLEISNEVIAAILATLGYSINDTIVIFSQIRDSLRTMKDRSIYDIVNISLNKTFRRTILTSISTALTVGAMFVFGGPVLRGFSLAFLIGIIFGTFSSIYVASPIMLLFQGEE